MSQPTKEFVELIGALAAEKGREVDEALFLGYWLGLSDIPIETLRVAVTRAIRECDRMPNSKGLRDLATGNVASVDRAQTAWLEFSDAVTSVGHYKSVDFEDKYINATIRCLGGWVRCCLVEGEEFETWLRKDFAKTYVSLRNTPIDDESIFDPMMGHSASCNGRDGFFTMARFNTSATGAVPVKIRMLSKPNIPQIEERQVHNGYRIGHSN